MSLVGRVFGERYEIRREIAQGGMAEVYLGFDTLLERNVALKALFPEYAREPTFVERFRREAQSAANLNFPGIVAIYDWGQEAGTYFIVMEYVEGRTLRDVIRSEGPVDPQRAADITADIAAALGFAHRAGVVHRDVKPGNVIITPDGTVKVTDFGIARAGTADGLTQTGSVMGTATYFSPEQAQGLAVDGRSDVYSLGVVLYEMVTGVAPFTGDSPVTVAYKHVREEVIAPTQRNPSIPADLERIILTALAKDVEARYQSAEDLRADLLRFRRGRPLAAAPITALVAETTGAQPTVAAPVAAGATQVGLPTVVEDPERRGNRRTVIALLVVLLLVGAVGLILWFATQQGEAQIVAVPNVIGETEETAVEILEDAGLRVEVTAVENPEDPDVEEGRVFDQDPEPGRDVDRGSRVEIFVRGPKTVPRGLVGLSLGQARERLEAAGFDLDEDLVVQSEPSDQPVDTVIDTDPAEGEPVPAGSVLTLTVAAEAVDEVPNVANLTEEDAIARLAAAGFSIGEPIREASNSIDAGRVIRTEPPAFEQVPRGTEIRLVISTGPDRATVPRVIGETEDDAKEILEANGFRWRVVEEVSSGPNVGFVIAQDPDDGESVQPGIVVVITVGIPAPPTTTTTDPPPTTTTTDPNDGNGDGNG